MNRLISVIVAIYNVEHVLERTLSCISNQTYRNLEIILVDDGSSDSSGLICDAFAEKDPRCKVIHKQNGGQGSAKNAGQAVANGDFLFFPDSDDVFRLDMLQILYEAITKDSSYDLAISGRDIVEEGAALPEFCSKEEIVSSELTQEDLIHGLFQKPDDRFVYGWNKLYRKELIEGLWCGDYPRHQDFDFNLRVFLKARMAVFVDLKLYYWVQRRGSKTHQPNSRDLYYKCRTALLYDNWIHLAPEHKQYEHYLLDALYRTMVFWEEWSRKSGNFHEVKAKCKEYANNTKRRYVRSHNIGVVKRAICLSLLAFPGIAHWIMKITNNAR